MLTLHCKSVLNHKNKEIISRFKMEHKSGELGNKGNG